MRMTVLRRVWNVVTWLVIAVVAFIALLTVALPMALGLTTYTVLTGSMVPALQPGHLIGVKQIPIEDVEIGDVVTYQIRSGDPTVVTHRVVSVTTTGQGERLLTTKGDANNAIDPEAIHSEQLVGVVKYAVPYLGHVNMWGNPAIKAVTTTVIGALLIGWGIVVLVRPERARTRRDRDERRARHARAVAVAATLAVSITGSGFASASEAAATQGATLPSVEESNDALQLSSDGTHWGATAPLQFQPEMTRWVPGDEATTTLWARNASPDAATLSIVVSWRTVAEDGQSRIESSDAVDLFLVHVDHARMMNDDLTHIADLQPGEVTEMKVTAQFDSAAEARQLADETIIFQAAVQLTEKVVVHDSGPGVAPEESSEVGETQNAEGFLAVTGSHPGLVFGGLAVLLIAGIALLRRPRSGYPDTKAL